LRNTLIFDLDGTLVDSCAICVEILNEMLKDRGCSDADAIDPLVARPWMSVGGPQMVAALLGSQCGDPDAEIADFRKRYTRKQTRRESLFPAVEPGLRELRQAGFELAICSNKPQALVDKVLADTELADLFSSVVGGRSGIPAKPAPDLLEAVLADLGVGSQECLFIGDSEIDHAVAECLDMPFLFLTHGYAHSEYVPSPDRSYDRFDDLTRTILAGHHA
jgi:phosphoglycolate phosphatase